MDGEEVLEKIEELQDADGVIGGISLDDWEREFLESIKEQVERGDDLTEAQEDKLQEVCSKL